MPYVIRKLPNKERFRVFNKLTKKVYAKSTTKKRALRQIRLLHMIDSRKKI